MKKYGKQMKQLGNFGLSKHQIRNKRKSKKKTANIDPYYLSSPIRLDVNEQEIQWIKKQPTYKEYLQSDVWRKKRTQVLIRDNHKCVHCGNKATEVHHKVYTIWGKEKLKHLESICNTCHMTIHDIKETK